MGSSLSAKGSTTRWRRLRAFVLVRDGHRCHVCGGPATEVDHVVPRALGGTDDLSNLKAICRADNLAKGSRIIAAPSTGGQPSTSRVW